MQFEIIILVLFGFWLIALSVLYYSFFRSLKLLTKDVQKGNLLQILTNVLEKEQAHSISIKDIKKEQVQIEDKGAYHIQKLGVVRFNPFKELGGEHSFSVALLDGHFSGFIFTGLHARDRTRMYIKPIKNGKCDQDLSEEERKALRLAQK